MNVYFDNAATTALDPEVLDSMLPLMKEDFGNPSSIHAFGRKTRAVIEKARKTVAGLVNASPSEIFFTSGGTEANNMAIRCGIRDMGLKHAITARTEHHAVLHTLEVMAEQGEVSLSFVNLTDNGHIDLDHLEALLNDGDGRTFVSLMHANNETGNVMSVKKAGKICRSYDAVFHSDMVQTLGHFTIDLQDVPVDFVSCSAHKFHGPKGIGFLYVSGNVKVSPLIYGGAQERNMRGGTENVYGIAGLGKAFEIAHRDMQEHRDKITGIKNYMIERLREEIPGVSFNGDFDGRSLYTVLNVSFPGTENAEMLLFNLDIAGIAASGGSACSSGSSKGSHVLEAMKADSSRPSVRFSFSKYSSREEVDYCVSKLKELFAVAA